MRWFWLITLRSLLRQPVRKLIASFGIILGVAVIFAVGLTNHTTEQAIKMLFQDTSGKSNLVITRIDPSESGLLQNTMRRLANLPGVKAIVPSLKVRTVLVDRDAVDRDVISESVLSYANANLDDSLMLFGVDMLLDSAVRDYTLIQGRLLSLDQNAAEVVLVQDFADANQIELGQQISILTPLGVQRLSVIGLIKKEGPGKVNKGAFGLIPLRLGQQLFGRSGEVDAIDVLAVDQDQEALENLKALIQYKVGQGYEVVFPASQEGLILQPLRSLQGGLILLGQLAFIASLLLIYNAFSMIVIERTGEYCMFRTIGMTRRQVIGLILGEAGLLGFINSSLGITIGILLSHIAVHLMNKFSGYELILIEIHPALLVTSFLSGLITTFIAAILPGWQAGQISGLEAEQPQAVAPDSWILRNGWWIGILLLVLGTGFLIWNPFPFEAQFLLAYLAVFILFSGGMLVIPIFIHLWERLSHPFFRLAYGRSGGLGSSNIQRTRQRTTLMVAVLMLVISTTIIVLNLAESFQGDLIDWMDNYRGGDLYGSAGVNLHRDVWRRIEAVEGVRTGALIRTFEVRWMTPRESEETIVYMGIDPIVYRQVTDFIFTGSQINQQAAFNRLVEGDSVFISSVLSKRYGLTVGDSIRLKTALGWHDFEIAAVVVNFDNQGLVVTGSHTDMARFFKLTDASSILLKLDDGVDVQTVKERINDLYGKRYHLSFVPNQVIKSSFNSLLGQVIVIIEILLTLAMIVAMIGLGNGLSMNIRERTREIGWLRGIGMTRSQVTLMILAEAGQISLLGAVLGVVFGYLLWRTYMVSILEKSGYSMVFKMPLEEILVVLLVVLVASQLTALIPAIRAARLSVQEAVRYE